MNNSQRPPLPAETMAPTTPQRKLMRRVVMIEGITVLVLLLIAGIWFAADALLLIFACILFAVLLYELRSLLNRRLGLHRQLPLRVVLLSLVAVIVLGVSA